MVTDDQGGGEHGAEAPPDGVPGGKDMLAGLAARLEEEVGRASTREESDGGDPPTDGSGHGAHGEHQAGVRAFEYRGHTVRIRTRYEIHIDDEIWNQDVLVDDDGTVHYHGLPQYSVASAVDLLKGVIDAAYAAPAVVLDAAREVE